MNLGSILCSFLCITCKAFRKIRNLTLLNGNHTYVPISQSNTREQCLQGAAVSFRSRAFSRSSFLKCWVLMSLDPWESNVQDPTRPLGHGLDYRPDLDYRPGVSRWLLWLALLLKVVCELLLNDAQARVGDIYRINWSIRFKVGHYGI